MTLGATTWAWEQDVPPAEKLCLVALSEVIGDPSEWVEWTHRNANTLVRLTGMTNLEASITLSSLANAGLIALRQARFDEREYIFVQFCMPMKTMTAAELVQKEIPEPSNPGYVYVLRGEKVYKIGRAKDPYKRSEQLAIQLPYEVELVSVYDAVDYIAAEKAAHAAFADRRLNGEWFDLTDGDLLALDDLMQPFKSAEVGR